jgi:hypothetical protein
VCSSPQWLLRSARRLLGVVRLFHEMPVALGAADN